MDMPEFLMQFLRDWGPRLLGTFAVLLVGRWLIRFAARGLGKVLDRQSLGPAANGFLKAILRIVLWVALAITVLGMLGVPTTSFIAVLGAAGLAVGLALQDTLANFAAGILLLVTKPIELGEYVQVAGVEGTVMDLSVMTTTLRTFDGRLVTIPNSQLTTAAITNFTRDGHRRVDLVFGISYDDDLRVAKGILEDLAASDERVLPEPEPSIVVRALGESSVDLAARVWVGVDDFWPLTFDWTERVKLAFDAAGITIPFPQRQVHVRSSGDGDETPLPGT
jgi:small conductance mechanosensitive channel